MGKSYGPFPSFPSVKLTKCAIVNVLVCDATHNNTMNWVNVLLVKPCVG